MASPTSAGSRYIFQINPGTGGNNNLTRRNYKRQSTPVYLNPDGSYDSSSCSSASIFTLSNGKLELDGQVVSTDPGIPFQPLTSSFVVLGISRNFVLVNVILVWQSGAFTGNAAIFCQVASGQAYVEFDGPPKPAYPPNCIVITLIAVPTSDCQNGNIVTSSSAPTQTSNGGTSSAPSTQIITGGSTPTTAPTQTS